VLRLRRAIEIYRDEGLLTVVKSAIVFYKGVFVWRIHRLWEYVTGIILSNLYAIGPVDKFSYNVSLNRLRQMRISEQGLGDVLETVYRFSGYGFYDHITPLQHPREIAKLACTVAANDPETIVEIGTDRGGTLYVWSRYTTARQIISIDNDFSSCHRSSIRFRNRRKFMRQFDNNKSLCFIEGDSHSEETLKQLEEIIPPEIDFLFIDGDHRYEGVKQDFEMYGSIVKNGGIIAIHDIKHPETGVPEFWREIKQKHETEEIYSTSEFSLAFHYGSETAENIRNHNGIGLIYM